MKGNNMNQKVANAVEQLYLDRAVFNEISGSATNNSLESFQLQRDLTGNISGY